MDNSIIIAVVSALAGVGGSFVLGRATVRAKQIEAPASVTIAQIAKETADNTGRYELLAAQGNHINTLYATIGELTRARELERMEHIAERKRDREDREIAERECDDRISKLETESVSQKRQLIAWEEGESARDEVYQEMRTALEGMRSELEEMRKRHPSDGAMRAVRPPRSE